MLRRVRFFANSTEHVCAFRQWQHKINPQSRRRRHGPDQNREVRRSDEKGAEFYTASACTTAWIKRQDGQQMGDRERASGSIAYVTPV